MEGIQFTHSLLVGLVHPRSPYQQRALTPPVLPGKGQTFSSTPNPQQNVLELFLLGVAQFTRVPHPLPNVRGRQGQMKFRILENAVFFLDTGIAFLLPENIFSPLDSISPSILFAFSPSSCLMSPPIWQLPVSDANRSPYL